MFIYILCYYIILSVANAQPSPLAPHPYPIPIPTQTPTQTPNPLPPFGCPQFTYLPQQQTISGQIKHLQVRDAIYILGLGRDGGWRQSGRLDSLSPPQPVAPALSNNPNPIPLPLFSPLSLSSLLPPLPPY